MFGLAALLFNEENTTALELITFCPQDLLAFNRSFPNLNPTGTSTFCVQDLSVFNRTPL